MVEPALNSIGAAHDGQFALQNAHASPPAILDFGFWISDLRIFRVRSVCDFDVFRAEHFL
jgi:hypothetical protein